MPLFSLFYCFLFLSWQFTARFLILTSNILLFLSYSYIFLEYSVFFFIILYCLYKIWILLWYIYSVIFSSNFLTFSLSSTFYFYFLQLSNFSLKFNCLFNYIISTHILYTTSAWHTSTLLNLSIIMFYSSFYPVITFIIIFLFNNYNIYSINSISSLYSSFTFLSIIAAARDSTIIQFFITQRKWHFVILLFF